MTIKLPRLQENSTDQICTYMDVLIKEIKKKGIDVSLEEIISKVGNSGKKLINIDFMENKYGQLIKEKKGNDGTYYSNNLLDAIVICANAATNRATKLYTAFSLGEIPRRQFDVIREQVDTLLLEICPDAVEKFISAYELLGSKSSEDWSLALTACRRIIKAVSDALYPPSDEEKNGRKMGEEQYINRLWAFLDDNMEGGSDKELAKAHVDYLGSFIKRINEKTSKGVHATVTYEEAVRVVLYTYLTLGDILQFADGGVKQACSNKDKIDINSGSYEELCKVPGFTSSVATGIIAHRAKKGFTSLDQLNDIKGIGPKMMGKARPHIILIPKKK